MKSDSRIGEDKWAALFGKAQGGACDSTKRQSPVALSFQKAEYSGALHSASFDFTDVSDDAVLEVENDGLKGI